MTDQNPTHPHPSAPAVAAGWYPDASTGQQRWWDGAKWTDHTAPPAAPIHTVVVAKNAAATAALVLGIVGIVLMAIPFFVGWFLGGIPDIIAVILGIIGLNNQGARLHVGKAAAIVGICLGGVSLLSTLLGAGSVW